MQKDLEETKLTSNPKPDIKVIDANDYLEVDRKSLKNENGFLEEIANFKPHIFSFVSCYSYVSMLKTCLEKTGIFSKLRLERNLITATKGRVISLDEQQKDILMKIAEPGNIQTKSLVIQGPEGSGKTLLGLEAAKMMINHHFNEMGLLAKKDKDKIRVIFSACFKRKEEVGLLMQQFKEELSDHWKQLCDIFYEPIEAQEVQNPKDFYKAGKQIQEILKSLEAKKKTTKQYKKNIIVIDELNPEFEVTDWSVYMPQRSFQVIFCLKYAFDDQKIKNKRKTDVASGSASAGSYATAPFSEGITLFQHVIVGKLQKGHRCSNQIRRLVYYLLIHSPDYERRYLLKDFNQGFHYDSFDAKYCPFWIEMKNVHVFIAHAKAENLHGADSDVMLIFDPDVNPEDLPKLKSFCQSMGWKCKAESDIVGAEASTVIIYDLQELHFEAFTRAINSLIIITTSSTKYVSFNG